MRTICLSMISNPELTYEPMVSRLSSFFAAASLNSTFNLLPKTEKGQ